MSAACESTFTGEAGLEVASRRRGLVESAIAYVEAREEGRTTVAEMCRALGVGRRTLEYAFREVLGTSPRAYFIQCALEAAHRVLRGSSPGDRTVTEVAIECGFWHLGRFSVTYRAVFGETPSQTLRAVA
jgi:AraC family transcriptional regulator, ethanolamine operon transcriptional activator